MISLRFHSFSSPRCCVFQRPGLCFLFCDICTDRKQAAYVAFIFTGQQERLTATPSQRGLFLHMTHQIACSTDITSAQTLHRRRFSLSACAVRRSSPADRYRRRSHGCREQTGCGRSRGAAFKDAVTHGVATLQVSRQSSVSHKGSSVSQS